MAMRPGTGIRLVIIAALAGAAAAADEPAPPGIWGRTILPQPFEKRPFREVRIPAWLEDTAGVGYTLSGQSNEQRERFVRAGVTLSELGFVDPYYAYYDSALLKRRSPHVPLSRTEDDVAAYRRLGLRILAVVPPSLQGECYELHPDWRRIGTNTTDIPPFDAEKNPVGGMLCLLGPYGDFLIELLAEITERYRVDAWSFDGLHYGGVCYCEHCRANFRAETGGEIPDVNLNAPEFRRYQHWADRRMEDLIQRMQTRLKSIQPEVALVTWTTNAGRFGHFRDIPRNMPARMNLLLDAPDQEFWLDETNRGATVVPAIANAYIWACTNHRVAFSEPYLMSHGNPYGKDSFPAHEVFRRMMLAVTHGAGPSLAVAQPEFLQPGADAALAELQRRKPWTTHKRPEPWGALVLSDNTRVFYGRESGLVEDRYLAHVFGCFRAVLEEHLPVTLACDWNLCDEDLSQHKVLVLPNTASLSDAQAAAIREYVRNGGGLVASLDVSLCDEFGDVRPDFALSDVLGVRAGQRAESTTAPAEELDVNFARTLDAAYWQNRKSVFSLTLPEDSPLGSETLRGLVGRDPVTFKGPLLEVTLAESPETSLAATAVPHGESSAPPRPAIVARTFGRGRVVYFAAGIDHANYMYSYPYQRVLLANAMRWAAGSPPPVEVRAPMCVHATTFRQTREGSERLLVHLFNDVNTTAFHALPNDDVPLREETIPIHDIEIALRGYAIRSAVQQPEGRTLEVERAGETASITVPRVDVHSVIVLELADDAR
ncbi:MAG: ThuA domain-containing protein [Planctomyces sp.]|nr:ThuA domain-containing protein [Planctomyces sp.]